MKGNNDLNINEATMMEAVQFWLDSQFVRKAPKVTGVTQVSEGYGKVFRISLDADAKEVTENP